MSKGKLVLCKTCGHQIAKLARKCPNCGKKRPLIERSPVNFVIAIVLCIIIVIGLFGNSGSESPSTPETNNASAALGTPTPTQTPTQEPTFEPIPLSVSNWDIVITGFYFADDISATLLTEYHPDENARFAVVEMSVKNLGKEADIFLPWISYGADADVKLKCDGYTFSRSELLLSDDNITAETLNPLVSASGFVVFNMPIELTESDAEIEIVISADWQNASAILR